MIRIGELARRAGISTSTLRAWERRYEVVTPRRSESGYRLYSAGDERRLRTMAALVDQGLAPAEAAERVRGIGMADGSVEPAAETTHGEGMRAELIDALLRFDDPAAERILDRAVSTLSVDALVGDLGLPALREIGERWSRGEATVGQEHFASNVLRGRLLGLGRGWGTGDGRLALLACPPGEHHDLGVIGFGLALRERGWRITFLGSDTPIDSIVACAEETRPDAVVIFAMDEGLLEAVEADLTGLSESGRLLLAGPGGSDALAERLGADLLIEDPLAAATSLAA